MLMWLLFIMLGVYLLAVTVSVILKLAIFSTVVIVTGIFYTFAAIAGLSFAFFNMLLGVDYYIASGLLAIWFSASITYSLVIDAKQQIVNFFSKKGI